MVKKARYNFGREPHYLPTLEEIAILTAEIRAGWNDEERDRRWKKDAKVTRKTDRDGIMTLHKLHVLPSYVPSFEEIG